MKILLLTGSINQGGAEFQLLALANLLQRRGYDIHVLALTNYAYYLPYINENNIPYSFISNEGKSIQRIYRSVSAINKIKPDLVISYIRATSLVAMLARVVSFFRFKLIISERTSLVLPKYDLLYFNLAVLANKITVNSVSKFTYIRKKFSLVKNRVVFVPNIIDIKKYDSGVKRTYNSGSFVLGCAGRISPEKNLPNLVKAILLLLEKGYQLQLNIIGQKTHASHFQELQTLISNSLYADRFDLQGPSNDMAGAYAKMDLLCHVSFYEGFPNVVAEALCSGLPVVGSNIEEISFLVKENENGFLVDPYSPEEIATGIERFLTLEPEEKASLADNSKKHAGAIFDSGAVYDKYAVMFESLQLKKLN